jgi:hypothetical protein
MNTECCAPVPVPQRIYKFNEDYPENVQNNKDFFEELSMKLQPCQVSYWNSGFSTPLYRSNIPINELIKGEYYHLIKNNNVFLYYSLTGKYYIIYNEYKCDNRSAYYGYELVNPELEISKMDMMEIGESKNK